jgi:hypothetical protein
MTFEEFGKYLDNPKHIKQHKALQDEYEDIVLRMHDFVNGLFKEYDAPTEVRRIKEKKKCL